MTLRKIAPLPLPGILTNPNLGQRPTVEWACPTDLYVDSTYQRDISKATMKLVKKVIAEFAWSRMKLPIAVRSDDGHLHLIDGQHTAIAAATLRIGEIPVMVVKAPRLQDRAMAFVAHNTDRVKVSSFDVFQAMVAAGDEESVEINAIMNRAKVRLRSTINASSAVAEGDTMAIGTVQRLYAKRGTMMARKVLQVLSDAKRAPITAPEIKAVEHVICVMKPGVDLVALACIIRADGDAGLRSAHSHSKVGRIPVWKALIERWKGRISNAGRAA